MKFINLILIALSQTYFCYRGFSEEQSTILIPHGSFIMGTDGPKYDIDQFGIKNKRPTPKHKVSLPSFYIDKYEVTQGKYQELIGINPSATKDRLDLTEKFKENKFQPTMPFAPVGKNYPVSDISWYDAVRFCNARSKKEGLEPCYDEKTWECDFTKNGYRLPTEAEWEYACRAGSQAKYFFGDDKKKLIEYANYWPEAEAWDKAFNDYIKKHEDSKGFSWEKNMARLLPVGTKKPNVWGLYDMLGNVYEWCNDWYDPNYYEISPQNYPKGPKKGKVKVIRGRDFTKKDASCYFRTYANPKSGGMLTIGFRCVRNAPKEEKTENKKEDLDSKKK